MVEHFNDSKSFIKYSNNMADIYKNIENYNPSKKPKILIAFDDMIADLLNNKKFNPIVTELFIRVRRLNIPLAFITKAYVAVAKDITLNSTQCFIIKFQINKNFIKLHLILHQILTLNTL